MYSTATKDRASVGEKERDGWAGQGGGVQEVGATGRGREWGGGERGGSEAGRDNVKRELRAELYVLGEV